MAARRSSLTRYRQKRNFSKTPEPKDVLGKKAGQRYLIQKHAATRLHYDFRLELDGVLKSWAVTRGPSLDPHDKRLAVEVEDHPVAYGSFEGTIPKGQYGGGTVMLWDEGSWEPIGDPRKGLANGKLEFRLHGKRLHGEWTLVRMRGRDKDKGRNNWLLIKHSDGEAKIGDNDKLLAKNITSVASGRSMEKIAAGDNVWQSKPKAASKEKSASKVAARKIKPVRLPAFIAPELATLADSMPKGRDWVHEIKFDGYRTLAYIGNGKTRMYTRTGKDWTHKFQSLADILSTLSVDSAIFDGEIVVADDKGVSSFKLLQEALSEEQGNRLHYYVFDLLYLNGKDLRKLPLLERKELLESLVRQGLGNRIFYSEHFAPPGDEFLPKLCSMQLEGIISKRVDSPYSSGRGKTWLKTKCHKRQEFVIGGFTLPTHEERGIGALLLGYYDSSKLIYAGKVGTGFDNDTSLSIRKKLDKLALKEPAFERVTTEGRRGAHWVKPTLICEIEFSEWTPDGHLRHPSFQGLREDKPAKSVHRDMPISVKKESPARSSKDTLVGGIKISHPDRIIYPGTAITKQQLAEYYLEVVDHILPHVKNRPLSMVRCPEGIGEACFFQRHIAHGQSSYLHDTGIKVKNRNETYLKIDDDKGLITLIQWGVIELHPWGCLADKPEKPDRIIFDLDPDPMVKWPTMIEAAQEVRTRLQELGLESFIKTTGGKGLHVIVPFARQFSWLAVKAFARAIAESMQNDNPKSFISTASKASRKGKIFVDYLRNDLTSTSVAPFSARARDGATVATPIDWSELKPALKPASFTIQSVPERLAHQKKDPWADFFKVKQKLSASHLRALKIDPH